MTKSEDSDKQTVAKDEPPPAISLGKRTAFALYWNFIGRMGMMLGRFFESIVMVALLGAAGFGVYKSAFNLMALVLPFTVLGLEAGVSRFLPEMESSGKNSAPLLRRLFTFRFVICIAAATAISIFAVPLAEKQLHDPSLWPMVVIAALIIIIHGLRNMQFRVLVARFQQKFLNPLQVAEVFGTLALAALFVGLFKWGGAGALLAIVVTGLGAIAIAGYRIRKTRPEMTANSDEETVTISRMIAFSGVFYAYNLIATIMSKQLGIFLLPRYHPDIEQVAFYDASWVIAFFVVSISGKALAEGITLTVVSEAKETGDMNRLRKIYLLLTEYMYVLTFPAMAGVYALGGDLIDLFYNGKMEGALVPLLVAMPFMAFHKMGGLTANFLAALDKERILVAGRIVTGILVIVLDILMIPKYGALGAVYGGGIAISLAVIYEIILMHFYIRPRYPWAYLAKMTLIGAGVFGAAWSVNRFLPLESHWLRLPPAVLAGIVVFAAGLWLLKPISRENLKLAETLKLPGKGIMMKLLMPKGNV